MPLTVPAVRRWLLLVVEPASAARAHHLHWSAWRRRHQALARQGHRARRAHRPPPAQPGSATPGPLPIVAVPGTAELSDGLWQPLAPLLAPAPRRRGRPRGDLRQHLEGMLAVMHRGGPWREVPAACGPWQTLSARSARWVRTGLWEPMAAILHPDLTALAPAAPP